MRLASRNKFVSFSQPATRNSQQRGMPSPSPTRNIRLAMRNKFVSFSQPATHNP
jgi:hypothetical protein